MLKRWDIFCKVVDNFGDIGVCWRLARQLQQVHGLQVRLWVDDLVTAQRLISSLDVNLNQQCQHAIEIVRWHAQADFTQAAEVVIEAFACGLPAPYLTAMLSQQSTWINVEYLSAESWVAACHAQPSPKPPLTRYFYFPGFTPATGGLLREPDLLARHQAFQDDAIAQTQFWQSLNLAQPTSRTISLFAYPHAPVRELLDAIVASAQPTRCLVPASGLWPQVARYFGQASVSAGETYQRGQLTVSMLPFLSQLDYDRLLSACDLNFVRGEDSWVRAIWAGKPFVWQPYPQEEETHLVKLRAFLHLYYAAIDGREAIETLHVDWAIGRLDSVVWRTVTAQHAALQAHAQHMAKALGEQQDLATQLVTFCQTLVAKSSPASLT
jgi:uncharacterized repeat protein (TIGR03837 family)